MKRCRNRMDLGEFYIFYIIMESIPEKENETFRSFES